MKRKAEQETFLLTVTKGALVPADGFTRERLASKGYRTGDVLTATLRKERNGNFHRLAHVFGELVAQNVDDFRGMSAHKVLKRLQLEAGIACEEMQLKVKDLWLVTVKLPKSLSYADMDDGEFAEVFKGMCAHVAETYWQGCTPDEIQRMADAMPQVA